MSAPVHRLVSLSVLLAALCATRVGAQSYSDPGSGLGLHGGVSRAIDGAGSSFAGGARLVYRLTGGFSLEIGFETTTARFDAGTGSSRARALTVHTLPVTGAVVWHPFPRSRFQPLVLAGGGWYPVWGRGEGVHASRGAFSDLSSFGLLGGAGVLGFTSERLALQADVRYTLLDLGPVRGLEPLDGETRTGSSVTGRLSVTYFF